MPHLNFTYKVSIGELLIFHTIKCCYSGHEYFHLFAIAAFDGIKYDMHGADAGMVRLRQETFSNG